MNNPKELFYTEDHEWIRFEENNTVAVIGISDFAQQELGDIVFVELEPEGTELETDAVFGTVEAVKTVAELFMPISGKILEVNRGLEDDPEQVNSDPYGDGWMIKISVDDSSEISDLLDADAYAGMTDI